MPYFFPRVKSLMHLTEIIPVEMRINLCCCNIRMSQHFLNSSQIRTAFDKMCCKGMAENMWTHLFIDICQFYIFLNNLPHAHTAQRSATAIQKDNITGFDIIFQKRSDIFQIIFQMTFRFITEWHNSFFKPFTHNPDPAIFQENSRLSQFQQFRNPQTATVENLKHGSVTHSQIFFKINLMKN